MNRPIWLTAWALLTLLSSVATAEETFKPRIPMDHQAVIEEAHAKLVELKPEYRDVELRVISIHYQYQPMPDSTPVCGPQGCKLVPAAPFSENLNV